MQRIPPGCAQRARLSRVGDHSSDVCPTIESARSPSFRARINSGTRPGCWNRYLRATVSSVAAGKVALGLSMYLLWSQNAAIVPLRGVSTT